MKSIVLSSLIESEQALSVFNNGGSFVESEKMLFIQCKFALSIK